MNTEQYGETWPSSSPSSTRGPETDMSRPGIEPDHSSYSWVKVLSIERDRFGSSDSFERSLLKGKADRFSAHWELFKVPAPFVQWLAIENATGNWANSSCCGFCFTSCKDWERRNEQLEPVANCATNELAIAFIIIANKWSEGKRLQTLMGSHRMEDKLKISTPFPLIRSRTARLISTDGTFNLYFYFRCYIDGPA